MSIVQEVAWLDSSQSGESCTGKGRNERKNWDKRREREGTKRRRRGSSLPPSPLRTLPQMSREGKKVVEERKRKKKKKKKTAFFSFPRLFPFSLLSLSLLFLEQKWKKCLELRRPRGGKITPFPTGEDGHTEWGDGMGWDGREGAEFAT